MPRRQVVIAVILSAVIAIAIGFLTAPEPQIRTVLHNISIGVVVSTIFYFMVVLIPGWQRRARIHANLQQYYNAFRLSCISTFLIASHSQKYHPREMLLDQREFRRYFEIDIGNGQTRWHAVLNALNENSYLLRDIQYELEILREELLYVLTMIDVHDEEVFAFLKRLTHAIYRLKDMEPEYDDIKYIGGFLWNIFTGWDFIEGYQDKDIVQLMINRIG